MAGDTPANPTVPGRSATKVFNCPSCGGAVQIRALGLTVSVACGSCGSIIDATDDNTRILSLAANKLKVNPEIPLGQRGKLRGTEWEVIGFMRRCDAKESIYAWSEYLLFNPARGFCWLVEFNGHWNYVITTKKKVTVSGNTASFLGTKYKLFQAGNAKVTYVVGEFYWRVKVGEIVFNADYVEPPEMLSLERMEKEETWSVATYVEPEEVGAAFKLKDFLTTKHGVAPNQPTTMTSLQKTVIKYWAIFAAVLFVIHVFTIIRSGSNQVFSGGFIYRSTEEAEKVQTTPSFPLKRSVSNVEIELTASVDNSWMSIDAQLINDETGESYAFSQGVEYYSGVDSDGSWSEGSKSTALSLSDIPAGTYHITVEPSSSTPTLYYKIEVARAVPSNGNFLWALVLISLVPGFIWWRRYSFEKERWSTSDFAEKGDD